MLIIVTTVLSNRKHVRQPNYFQSSHGERRGRFGGTVLGTKGYGNSTFIPEIYWIEKYTGVSMCNIASEWG